MACDPCVVVVLSRTINDVLSRGNYTRKGSARFYLTPGKPVKLEYLISIDGATLVVYRIDEHFQYEILFWDSSLYEPQETYNLANQARDVGLELIKTTVGYL